MAEIETPIKNKTPEKDNTIEQDDLEASLRKL